MLKKSLIAFFSFSLVSTSLLADGPRQSPWNYSSASNYALQWALSRNPNYISFTNDCTNFVSQALRTGGWKDTATLISTQMHSWFYKSGTNYAQTWSTANGLRNRVANGYELGTTKLGKSFAGLGPEYLNNQIRVGDIILADWTGDGIYDHAMMVTQVSFSETLVSYHTTDRKNFSMADVAASSPNAKFEVYHIT
ncbi:amidase domain-containing protein [Acinetobacter sp. NIPH 2699]|uniref:amidase domain-containing protein n=1 Tax=Acinetobacter sp. NIPH 2699 TaxID=2923433 RepID=UPI001F4B4742|nr:amidase domain-containing protein [Acinetobacter sp. NIPH 2699]MCH7335191.1 amidase domain-containing protein [Acinetobacter sp. NIPH 2699]